MKEMGQVLKIMKALLISYVITGFLLLLTAALLYRLELSDGMIRVAVILVYACSCFFGGFAAGRMLRNRRFFWGLLLGSLYFLVMLVLSAAVSRELSGTLVGMSTTWIICAGAGMIGGVAS